MASGFAAGISTCRNYVGTDAPAHSVHVRHIPTTWAALDAAGAP